MKDDVATCLETEVASPVAADTAACLAITSTALDTNTACAAVQLAAGGGAACTYTAASDFWPLPVPAGPASSTTTKKDCLTALPGHDCHFKCKKRGTHTDSLGTYTSATGEYLALAAIPAPNNDGTCTVCPAFVSVSANGGPIPSQLQRH